MFRNTAFYIIVRVHSETGVYVIISADLCVACILVRKEIYMNVSLYLNLAWACKLSLEQKRAKVYVQFTEFGLLVISNFGNFS